VPTVLRLKQLSKSLFIRLLASFMLIIVLLSSFNYVSVTFLRNQIHDEVITYNNLNLKQTMENYESHLKLVNNVVLGIYMSERVQILGKSANAYDIASKLRTDIQTFVANPQLYLDNIVLFFEDRNFILEKDGSSDATTMFTKFYGSDSYSYDFWKKQFEATYYYHVFPAAEFKEETFVGSFFPKGKLIPMVIKNKLYPDLYIITLLNADQAFRSFHRSINENFIIMDDQGHIVYTAGPQSQHALPPLPANESYVRSGDSYYFYNKSPESGLTYVNIIPDQEISSKVSRLNITLFTLLLVAIAIGIGTSVLFSVHFNNPVKKIIQSIRSLNTSDTTGMSSNEYEQIHTTIQNMFMQNKSVHQVLDERNSLLTYYTYMNKVKNIHHHFDDFKELTQKDRRFRFVLFELFFTDKFHEESEVSIARASYFLREIIRQYMITNYKDSHTFQMENQQVLTVVFIEEDETDLGELLVRMKGVFEHDTELCFMTMALSPEYMYSADFTKAYEHVLRLSEARVLNAELQIIEGNASDTAEPITMTVSQEQEFDANIRSGNDTVVIPLVKRMLGTMHRKSATAVQLRQFARDIIDRTIKTLVLLGIDYKTGEDYTELLRGVERSHTLEQLTALTEQALGHACRLIQTRKEQRDPMTTFVLDYLESHYHEDITLDMVADKLDISSGYLSSYFKEKTGKNLIDYVHEVRITKAKGLLLRSDLKIQDAAAQVGYNNLNSFNRMFKKYTGMTPTEFRRSGT
jgi:two-component system response regulator YesN